MVGPPLAGVPDPVGVPASARPLAGNQEDDGSCLSPGSTRSFDKDEIRLLLHPEEQMDTSEPSAPVASLQTADASATGPVSSPAAGISTVTTESGDEVMLGSPIA